MPGPTKQEMYFTYKGATRLKEDYENFVGQHYNFSVGGPQQRLVLIKMEPVDELGNLFRVICLGQSNALIPLEEFMELNKFPPFDPARYGHVG